MQSSTFIKFDLSSVPSPCFVIDEVAIERNLQRLNYVQEKSGAKILAALKAFSCWHLAPLVNKYLSGVCASGYHEARLGYEEYTQQERHGELHVFSAAFSQKEFDRILPIADHIVFNSFSQWGKYKVQATDFQKKNPQKNLSFGLRINPQHSEGSTKIYDPCAAGSRLGIPISEFSGKDLKSINGLHFHTLCEQGLEPLRRTLAAVEKNFSAYLFEVQWVNFGGGHHISHPDYDIEGLITLIQNFSKKYNVQVYLEPGEAIAIQSGILVSEILDIMHTDCQHAILDTSATCHMPDTLEMPYRPDVFLNKGVQSGEKNQLSNNYRLGGMTCLAGDVVGDYSFNEPLKIGDRIIFDDMAHYTMVKTNTFNGIQLPTIAVWNSETNITKIIKEFDYSDFKCRLS